MIKVPPCWCSDTDCNQKKPDLVFLLDTTLAASDADWTALLSFVQTFARQFDLSAAHAHVALVSFADTQTTHFRLGQLAGTAHLLQVGYCCRCCCCCCYCSYYCYVLSTCCFVPSLKKVNKNV